MLVEPVFATPDEYWNIYDVYEMQAKRLYFCASNKYDFLEGAELGGPGREIDKRIMAELKRKRNL